MLRVGAEGEYELLSCYRTAPNIGLIKYWGKWHEEEIIPLNTNVGISLASDSLRTLTTVVLRKQKQDQMVLNGEETQLGPRIERILKMFRTHWDELRKKKVSLYGVEDQEKVVGDLIPDFSDYRVLIKSKNFFPSGSGLASSSSGLAALALCLGDILKSEAFDVRYISRIGSGSACRTLFGCLVQFPGVSNADLDRNDMQVVEKESKRCLPFKMENSEWVRDKVAVLIMQDQHQGKKEVLSKDGMQKTAQTSELFQERIKKYSDKHIFQMNVCLKEKKLNGLMEVVMRDSNQFHATCMDTYPPLFYMNTFSMLLIKIVHRFNQVSEHHVGYTFDAGAHGVLLVPFSV